MRWHYRDKALLWLFVPAFAIHVAEEWFGGFTTWIEQVAGGPMSGAIFLAVNAAAMLLLVIGVRAASRAESYGWIAVTIATIALINTGAHAAGAALTESYSPGLISAVVLFAPLGSLTMIRALDQAPRGTIARGVIVGVVLHAFVFVVAFASTR